MQCLLKNCRKQAFLNWVLCEEHYEMWIELYSLNKDKMHSSEYHRQRVLAWTAFKKDFDVTHT